MPQTNQDTMFLPKIDNNSPKTKVLQLVEQFRNAILTQGLSKGERLPSVNELMKTCSLSRDTVVKGYNELKLQGLIIASPQKGYFVAENNKRLLLVLDTFKAYKEELYASIIKHLPEDYEVELVFHHYNVEVLESVLNQGLPRCSACAVMSFDHPNVPILLSKVPKERLLIIDWNIRMKETAFIGQDFGQTLYDNLNSNKKRFEKYQKLIYLFPTFTYHPQSSIVHFERFCKKNGFNYEIKADSDIQPQKGEMYLLVSDRTMAHLLNGIQDKQLSIGEDVGILSYNETPLKKYLRNGISAISTDFYEMGKQIANWTQNNRHVNITIPTTIILRDSL